MATLDFCLFLLFFVFSAFARIPDQTAFKSSLRVLSKPLIGDDGRIYACSDNDFFSFESNGSIAWSVHLNFICDSSSAPIYSGAGQILVLADNRILRIYVGRNETSKWSEPDLFFDPGETIIGFAVSILSSSVYITVKNRALYAYNMFQQQQQQQPLWIAEPKLERFGYRLGCRKDFQDCSFNSQPVIDACESSIYISNNQGELYSLSLNGAHFQWIQDLSYVDMFFTVKPGNNGLVYVVFPVKSLVLALDSFSGNIQWQKTIGPLAASGCDPVVDSNGWVSIGSLDGWLYSFSPTGNLKKFPKRLGEDLVIQVEPLVDCSGTAVYVSQTKMEGKVDRVIGEYTYVSAKKPENAVFTLLVPKTGSVFWSQSYPDQISSLLWENDLQHFVLDERIVLAFIAVSKTGNPLRCRSKYEKLASSCSMAQPEHLDIGNEEGIIWFILFEFVIIVLLALLVRFCCIFWKKKKLQEQPLRSFLEKRRSLQQKKKEMDRRITELEKEASSGEEMIGTIRDLVEGRENVKRKLSSTYSLGRDNDTSNSKTECSVLPLYAGDSRTFSFRSSETDTFTTPNDESSFEQSSDDDDDDDEDDEGGFSLDRKQKGKVAFHSEGSNDDDDYDDDVWSIPSSSKNNDLKKRVLSLN